MIVEGKVSSKRKEKKEGCGSKGITGGGGRPGPYSDGETW